MLQLVRNVKNFPHQFRLCVNRSTLTSNCGLPSAVNLMAVIPVPKVAPMIQIYRKINDRLLKRCRYSYILADILRT